MSKKIYPHLQPWTPFERATVPDSELYIGDNEPPAELFVNSRYQVSVWYDGSPDHPMGEWAHLSIKDHDRSARHDWRDYQRIKNELFGPEFEAIEIYPAESRLVDTCNQYHLYVFKTWRPPQGFRARLVADEGKAAFAPKAQQRPFERGQRPADCLTGDQLDAVARRAVADAKARQHGISSATPESPVTAAHVQPVGTGPTHADHENMGHDNR
jgi:hypothetical protein